MVDANIEISTDAKSAQLEKIQREVITLLGDVGTLIESTKKSVIVENSHHQYNELQQQFKNAQDNVAELQLRMSIIAPMKAGKSTIINAIAGQELLPSCATAMTTIPTEIVFSTKLTEPTLQLDNKLILIVRDIYTKINSQIEELGIDSLEQKLARYPHLIYLLTEIKEATDVPFAAKIEGAKKINQTLNLLNQIIRLDNVIDPLAEPLAQLTIIPRIVTPFLGMAGIEKAKNLGDLVIVDTPGPNEAGVNLKLSSVVEEQLRRSSVILLVLDYTQLNNEAAEAINKQIQPILNVIGKENLYVLINKIDQRRKGDISSEQIKNFVFADLDLDNKDTTNRIFEISAIRAFAATQFLLEMAQKPRANLLEINSLETIAQEVFGIDWDEEIEDITPKILSKKAHKLWKKSGFAPFLEETVAKLMESAAPLSLMIALNLSHHRLLELKDNINFKGKAITKDKAKLKEEIQALKSDLTSLESCQNNLQQMEEIKKELRNNLESIITKLKEQAKVNLENYFNQQEYEKGDLMKKADMKTRELLLTNIGDFDIFPQFLSKNIKSNFVPKTTGIISFEGAQEATKFSQEAVVCAKEKLEKLLLSARQKIDLEVVDTNKKLKYLLKKETQPIVERAQARLQKTFEIDLELSSPNIDTEENLQMKDGLVKKKSRLVETGYEEQLIKKRAWYYWFGLVPFYSKEIYQKPYKKANYYTVSVYDLVEQINVANDRFIDEIGQRLLNYIEEDIQQQVERFFLNLDNYFGSYIKNIQQAQQSKELSLEQRDKLIKMLACLLPKTTEYIEQTETYLQLTEEMLSQDN